MQARAPELAPLARKRVAVVGLGGIGGPSAIEFARGGVGQLRILDRDVVEPGPTVRWPFGFAAEGLGKARAIEEFVAAHYPYTEIIARHHWIGAVAEDTSDLKVLDEFLDGVDLIYEASAELGLQHLLADQAARRHVPYLCVSTTTGAWGGLLARIAPGRTDGCWLCLQHHLNDGSIPVPMRDVNKGVKSLVD